MRYMLMLFNKLTLISIAAIIAIASILVFIIPTDSIETQSVINSEKPHHICQKILQGFFSAPLTWSHFHGIFSYHFSRR